MDNNIKVEYRQYAILTTIKNKKNLNVLVINNNYASFFQELDDLQKENYISIDSNEYKITPKGAVQEKKLRSNLNLKGINKFIFPEFEYFVDTISSNEIYLP